MLISITQIVRWTKKSINRAMFKSHQRIMGDYNCGDIDWYKIKLEYVLKIIDNEDVLLDSFCMYQPLVIYRVPLCVTRTDLCYHPLTLQPRVQSTDATSSFTMNDWMILAYPDGYELTNVFTELCEVIVQGKNIPWRRWTFYYFYRIMLIQKAK